MRPISLASMIAAPVLVVALSPVFALASVAIGLACLGRVVVEALRR